MCNVYTYSKSMCNVCVMYTHYTRMMVTQILLDYQSVSEAPSRKLYTHNTIQYSNWKHNTVQVFADILITD